MTENSNLDRRNRLIEEYQEYVHGIVAIMIQTMGLPAKAFDEFASAGYLGLVEAASRFDFKSGREFKYFAFLRIRGAVIDSIRECSDLTGKAYHYAKAMQAANDFREFENDCDEGQSLGEKSTVDEKLGGILESAAAGLLAYRLTVTEVEEEISECNDNPHDPEIQFIDKQKSSKLHSLVATLPEKERLVIEDFYFKDKSFVEIAKQYEGMSKSWVSRLHARALVELQSICAEEAELL